MLVALILLAVMALAWAAIRFHKPTQAVFIRRVVIPYALWRYRRKRLPYQHTPRTKRSRHALQLRRIRRAQAKRAWRARGKLEPFPFYWRAINAA